MNAQNVGPAPPAPQSVGEYWENFATSIPFSASADERAALEEAFYSGAAALLFLVSRALKAPAPQTAVGELASEIGAFVEQQRGKAEARQQRLIK